MKTRMLSTFALMLCALLILPIKPADAQAYQPGKHLNRSAKADLKIQTLQQTGQSAIRNGKLEIPFQMTIQNNGTAASIDNVVNGIRISNVYHWSGFMSAIAPNGSKVINGILKMNPPDQALPNRELHLIAMTDAPIAGADTSIPNWGRVNESDESNNTKALGVQIPSSFSVTSTPAGNAAPNGNGAITGSTKTVPGVGGGGAGPMDLRLEQFEVQGQVQYRNGNIEIPVQIKVRNLGSLPSPNNLVNGVEFGNTFIWSSMMDSVPANSFRVATGVVKIPDPGQLKKGRTLKLIAMADAPIAAADTSIADWGRVQESDETNNRRELSVKVPGTPSFGVTSTPAGNAAPNGGAAAIGSTKSVPGVGGGGAGPMDLVVEQFEVQGQVQYRNGNIEIPVRIKVGNLGSLPSPKNMVNGVEFGNKFIWSGMMDSVPANSFRVATGVVKIPDPGQLKKGRTLKLIAMADAPIAAADTSIADWGRVQESDETNNRRELSVKVPGSSSMTSK